MGRALASEYVKYGVRDGWGLGTGIALPGTRPVPTPGTPLPPPVLPVIAVPVLPLTKYGRGALNRRSTLFKCPFLKVLRYYRGI